MVNKEILNGSGCKDLTAYEAIKHVEREERRKKVEKTAVAMTVKVANIVGTVKFPKNRTTSITLVTMKRGNLSVLT